MTSWDAVVAAVGLALSGERAHGRIELMDWWQQTTVGDHAVRCVLAHYLADCQDDLDNEVAWDKRALAAYAHLAPGDLAAIGIPDAAGMAPSLHLNLNLNLGDGYLRQGRRDDARAQFDAGLAACTALGDDGYATMIRKGLDGLRDRVAHAG